MAKKRKPRALTRDTRQTGSSDMARDKKRKALAPGKRISKNGKIYYENRKNRSDVKGRDTPTSSKKKTVTKYKLAFTPERKKRVYEQYKKNESRNAHSQNALMLINLFGTESQRKKALEIVKKQMKRGHILKSESDWMYKYGHCHYNKIKPKTVKRITKTRVTKPVVRKSVIIGVTKDGRKMMVKDITKKPKEPLRNYR